MLTFADFIAPFDPVEFRTQYYGKKPLHIRRQGQSGESPLPWARFNEVLALTPYWNEDTLRVYFKDRLALRENYCDVTRTGDRAKALIDPRKVKALIGLGASLVANHIHRVCPEVAAISQMFQREFAAESGANVYCSFKQVQAFSTHFDLHDVFALQTEGEKLWHVYASRADNPIAPLPPGEEGAKWLVESRGRLLMEVLMRPGDILYLPRGQYHDAITGAEASLHVTHWVKPATGLSIFKLLESALESESEFRAYLPDASNAEALKEHLSRLTRHMERVVSAPSFAVDVRNHQRAFATIPTGFELPSRTLPQFYSTVMGGQVVRRQEGFVAVFGKSGLPLGSAYPAVEWLLTQRMFSFDDLAARHPFVDEGELRDVVQRLLAIGAIVETEMR
jgi:ribosomal protein L16 Arg81 hydroxylase